LQTIGDNLNLEKLCTVATHCCDLTGY